MALERIPYFVTKPGRAGPRHFWQPSTKLRAAGWTAQRLSDDRAEAIAQAQARNAELNAWRSGVQAPVARRPADTVSAVIDRYRASDRFTGLAPKTQADYRWILNVLQDWAGDLPIGRIKASSAADLYDRLARQSVSKAASVGRIGRIVWGFAELHGHVDKNIWRLVRLRTPAPRLRIWTPDEFAAILHWADLAERPSIGDAVVIGRHFAQRLGDILALGRLNYQDGRLRLRQSKRRAQVSLPRFALVGDRLDAALARLDGWGVTAPQLIVSEQTGAGYTVDNFSHRFADVRAAAARDVPSCATLRFQDLRDTGITSLAEAGCTFPEIAAISGHSETHIVSVLDHYLALNDQVADNAIVKLLAHHERQAAAHKEQLNGN